MTTILRSTLLVGLSTLVSAPAWATPGWITCEPVPDFFGPLADAIRDSAAAKVKAGWELNATHCWPEIKPVNTSSPPMSCPISDSSPVRDALPTDYDLLRADASNTLYKIEFDAYSTGQGCSEGQEWPNLKVDLEIDPTIDSIAVADTGSQIHDLRIKFGNKRQTWANDLYGDEVAVVFVNMAGDPAAIVEAARGSDFAFIGHDSKGHITAISADGDVSKAKSSGITGVWSYSSKKGLVQTSTKLGSKDLAWAKEIMSGE